MLVAIGSAAYMAYQRRRAGPAERPVRCVFGCLLSFGFERGFLSEGFFWYRNVFCRSAELRLYSTTFET